MAEHIDIIITPPAPLKVAVAQPVAGVGLPVGGLAGQVLRKTTDSNYAVGWDTPQYVPPAGTTGQVLTKDSNGDHDTSWQPIPVQTEFPYLDILPDAVTIQERRVAWDNEAGTLVVGMPGGNVNLQVGQEELVRVRNVQGAPIPNGAIVYVFGATGQTPTVKLAGNDTYTNAIRTIGMATEPIANNDFGYVTTVGIVRDINTNGIPEGSIVYLGLNGGFTHVEPAYPACKVWVGVCLYEGINNGRILFAPKILWRKFGNPAGGNYTGIDDDGHVINYGNARTWNDLPPIPLLNQRSGGANVPALTTFLGNIQQLTFAINDYLYGNYELLHEYAEGTDLSPHIHMVTNGVDTTDRNVRWELEYTICNADAQAPYTSAFPATQTIFADVTIPANTPNRSHVITMQFPDISGVGLKIGAYIVWRLRRVASLTGTAPTANPFGLTLGFHVLQNTQGSDTIGQKTIGSV